MGVVPEAKANLQFQRDVFGTEQLPLYAILEPTATGAKVLNFYRRAPGYRTLWQSLGFAEGDIDALSPRFVDALVAWGDEDAIRARVEDHLAAGADHVCLQVLHPEHGQDAVDDHALAALAPA